MTNFTKLLLAVLFAFTQIFSTQAQTSTLISNCSDFTAGPTAWPYVLTATTVASGVSSQASQTFTINVTSLPTAGANVRVFKTTANGNSFFGPATPLTLGSNTLTVSAVTFNRAVKFQFSSGNVGFDALSVNGVASTCTAPAPPATISSISSCGDFTAGPAAWPYVLTATTVASGVSSQASQTFTMNVTSLPAGGADVRVFKTTANGSSFFGPATTLTLGSNSLTVPAVTFNRAVKFQFSSGSVDFDALSVNGVASTCTAPIVVQPLPDLSLQGIMDFTIADQGYGVSGAQGKAIHVRATAAISDLSIYGIGVANNGGGTDGQEYTFPAISVSAGDDILVARSLTAMSDYLRGCYSQFDHVILASSSAISQNGDDAIELFENGVVIETFGDINVDGTGQPWEYLDSWAYKTNSGTSGAFVIADWSFGGVNCTDGTSSIYASSCMYPVCNSNYVLNMVDSWGDGWNGNNWTATGIETGTVYGPFTIATGSTATATFSSSDFCFTIACDGGSFQGEVSWTLEDGDGNALLTGGAPYLADFNNGCAAGCMDPLASNYDVNAQVDDGSCSYAPCGAPAPYHETFSTGLLPVGTCVPNQWATSVTTGDGWRFAGNPGYTAGSSPRSAGTYAWVDFSATDAGVILEVEDVDVSTLANPTLFIDYLSDIGTLTLTGLPNALHIEGYDGTAWVAIDTLQLLATGWNTYSFSLSGALNGTIAEIRFRAESGGSSNDYYNDLLLDDVRFANLVLGCMDSAYSNYDPLATVDDGSCTNTYTLDMSDSWGDGWNGNVWTATGLESGNVYGPYTITALQGSSNTETFSSTDNCFSITCDGGSFQGEVSWDLQLSGASILTGGAPYNSDYNNGCATGCTDALASNYNPNALVDDGSCIFGPCAAPVPYHETFSAGTLPSGYCPNQWAISATTGDGWRFTGTPGFNAATNGRASGTYAWVDFSSTDAGVILEVEDVDISTLTTPGLVIDYFSDLGTFSCDNNILHIEAYDGSAWINVSTLQLNATGWNTYSFSLAGMTNVLTGFVEIRFRAESSGSSCDYFNDLLLDDVKFENIAIGCTDSTYSNYDPLAIVDDGSCINSYTLYMNDSWGDGWNGNFWTATGLTSGTVYGPFTLLSGSSDSVSFSSTDNCFSLTCDLGAFQSEVSWDLHLGGTSILTGGAPFTGTFGNNCISGCTDPTACNYDPNAHFDDGSCIAGNYFTVNMYDSFGDGWNGNNLVLTDQSGAVYFTTTITSGLTGVDSFCTDILSNCYTVTCDGGSWQGEVSWDIVDASGTIILSGGAPYTGNFGTCILGCTDPTALNYDAAATVDDGGCIPCGNTYYINMYDSFGDGWNGSNLVVTDTSGNQILNTTITSGSVGIDSLCANLPLYCYGITVGGGSWMGEVSWDIVDSAGTIILSGGAPYTGTFGTCVYGCTDPTAVNYDPLATVDDGNCSSCDVMTLVMNDSFGDGWNGNRWQLVDLSGNIFFDTTLTTGSTDTISVCALAGFCYEVVVDYGAWQGEVSWSLLDGSGATVLSGGAPYSGNYVGSGCIYGCMEPFADNYDLLANLDDGSCSYAYCVSADTSESFESFPSFPIYNGDFNLWQQATDDGGINWQVETQGTPSFNTGPNAAYDGANYIYIETSVTGPGQTASIFIPCVDLSAWNNPSIVFAYHMWGFTMGTLELEISSDGGATWDSLWAKTGQQGSSPQWFLEGIDLSNYSGTVAIRFVGTAGSSFTSDMALDAISIEELPVFACMDPNASNYDPTATSDDGSCTYATTFNVDMGCVAPGSFSSVSVESPNLSCNNGCITLSDPDGDDIWSVTLDLVPGNYIYLYAIDNNSSQENLVDDVLSGNGSCAPYTDYFSFANREVVVGTASITADDTYGSCDPCIRGCMDPGANNYDSLAIVDNGTCEYDVTFVVDMNCSGLTPTMVAATGYQDSWSGNTYVLADTDGDGIWEGTYSVPDSFVYIYAVDNWATSEFYGLLAELQNGTNSCAPFTDGISYAYRLAASPSTTSDTYGQCTTCPPGCTDSAASNYNANAQIDDGSCVYATTFNVDMNCEVPGSFGFVHLESPVFGWCGGCVPMADPDGDGVHSVTIDLPLGSFEYKYAVDNWAGQENLIDDMQNGASCAPVTDYFSYANRLVTIIAGLTTSDTYGSCDTCDQQFGCTDAAAVNYDALATEDDGSCLFSSTFNVDMNCEPVGSFGYVHLESPSFGWCGGCVPMSDPDGDGIHSVSVDLPAGNFEYKYAVDGFAGQEDLVDDMINGATCAPVTDYFSYANRLVDVNASIFISGDLVDNGEFNSSAGWTTNGTNSATGWAIFNGVADLWWQGGSGEARLDQFFNTSAKSAGRMYLLTFDADVTFGSAYFGENWGENLLTIDSTGSYSFEFVATNTSLRFMGSGSAFADLTIDNVQLIEIVKDSNPILDNTYGSCDECITGCMDSLAFNYNDSASVDDGSCLYAYNCPAPYPIGLSSSDTYAEMATIHWADANGGSCMVEKYFVRYRPVGDSVWITKAAGIGSGLCNVGLPNTSKVLRNLMPSTTYEFKMKAFYCGGGQSAYSYTEQFTTLDACPPMTNLAVQTFGSNSAKAKFTWDETGPYTFARIALRVNTAGSAWQTAGGFGVNYPQFNVLKFGLISGTEYRAQGRTFCDPVVTSYRSTWTAPIVWTQPGVAPIRLEGGSSINNLEVYPNPSKDIFNVSFVSEDIQNLEVRVLNLIGEVVYTEGLEQFVGEYTKSINLSNYTKGVYFLEITTNNGVVNKKIVLQ